MKSAETAMKKIRYALAHNKQLEVKLSVYGMPQRRYIDLLLSLYLEECGLIELKDRLLYCMHELAGNAHKANAKRLFFERSGFDIFDKAEYEAGMGCFKQTVSDDLSSYNRLLTEQGYYVCFRFHLKGGTLALQVINSARLLQTERERIASKIEIARCYTTLTDAYTVAEDFSEGAGLGIVMIHIMLKAIGFRNFSFSVDGDDQKTVSSLFLDVTTCRPVLPAGETSVSSSM